MNDVYIAEEVLMHDIISPAVMQLVYEVESSIYYNGSTESKGNPIALNPAEYSKFISKYEIGSSDFAKDYDFVIDFSRKEIRPSWFNLTREETDKILFAMLKAAEEKKLINDVFEGAFNQEQVNIIYTSFNNIPTPTSVVCHSILLLKMMGLDFCPARTFVSNNCPEDTVYFFSDPTWCGILAERDEAPEQRAIAIQCEKFIKILKIKN